jgi:site-specific DNA-methyltransferase (adenine-specific)
MLNENPSTTSRDLELAEYLTQHPQLAKMPTKSDAVRQFGVAYNTAVMHNQAQSTHQTHVAKQQQASGPAHASPGSTPAKTHSAPAHQIPRDWVLHEGKFQDNIGTIPPESVDLILTDLPYGIGMSHGARQSHSAGLSGFADTNLDIRALCADTAASSYRILLPNRFGVFFYGMAYHEILRDELQKSGFIVDPYPFIWLRDRSAPPDGFARYSKTYDPALIASKGKPRFIRPNLPNTHAVPSVRGAERLHAAQKPVELMRKFIEDMTIPGCTVVDMFAGAGSTGVAALRANRRVILFEYEPANCLIIRSRLGSMK